ncbi:MAG: hypothetical protein Q9M89_05585 [Persephonella sp.]|nr:hypothetical protein [Persephonella sp.]
MIRLLLTILLISGIVLGNELSIKTDDGFVLKGFLYYPEESKEKYPVVVFAHQFGTTHIVWSDFAKAKEDGICNTADRPEGAWIICYSEWKRKQNCT